MSDTEEKVYRQTYHLDDSDSDSSAEVQYIQASDLPKEEVERILASYKAMQSGTAQKAEDSEESDKDAVGETEIHENNYQLIPAPSWLTEVAGSEDSSDSKPNTLVYKATYKASNQQTSSAEVASNEDSNEEPKPNAVVYKTTYKTSKEHLSSAEASCDEDSEDELEAKGITYKKIYTTFREQESEVDDNDDPDYEPKEERIKRYKKRQRMYREEKLLQDAVSHNTTNIESKLKEGKSYKATIVTCREKQPCPEVLFGNNTNDELNTANIRKLKKSSIELQPTPGADFIEIPIPNCNPQKFKQTYREEWEKEPYLKDWIQPWLEDSMYAYCKFCKCKLTAHKKSLKDHSNTKKHRKNVFDVTGAWGGTNPKPATLTYLVPRARRKTEKILMNDYDSTSLSFANSSDFNMRVINDPLLPISS